MKINTFRNYKGGLSPEADDLKKKKKKKKKNGGFSLFFAIGKAPYIPKIMSLLPSSS